jgi:post-segregation antitoxin (ccd killing protein)
VEEYVVVIKSNVTVYLNAELANLAREMGLNISKTCENALKQAITRLQGINVAYDSAQQFSANKNGLVDRAGFEPAASALRTRRL